MIVIEQQSRNGLQTSIYATQLGDREKQIVRTKFKNLKERNVLLSEYADDEWNATSQTQNVTFDFSKYSDLITELIGLTAYRKFIDDLKAYTVLYLETIDLRGLQNQIHFIERQAASSNMFTDQAPTGSESQLNALIEFLELTKYASSDYIDACYDALKALPERKSGKGRNRRSLAEFVSYLRFNEELNNFWANASSAEKSRYYPLYLFWIITSVIPLRVTEWCVTPYDCLRHERDEYRLCVRRSRLKGNTLLCPKLHAYTIAEDYEIHTYKIPQWLYDEINTYRQLTATYHHPFDILVSTSFQNAQDGRPETDVFYDGDRLNELIRDFYVDVLEGKCGLKIVSKDEIAERAVGDSYKLYPDEIMLIKAGDTRHISMINLLLRGCNPMMLKEFSGHATDAMAFHYAGNMSTLIRCAVRNMFDMMKADRMKRSLDLPQLDLFRPMPLTFGEYVEVDGGDCYSQSFICGKAGDCAAVRGKCKKCRHFDGHDNHADLSDSVDESFKLTARLLRDDNIDAKIEEFQVKAMQLEKDSNAFIAALFDEERRKYYGTSEESSN